MKRTSARRRYPEAVSSRPQRLSILTLHFPPEPTGNAPYAGALSRGLAQEGVAVRALTAHPHYPAWRIQYGYGQWSRREVIDGVHLHRLRHYVPRTPSGVRRLLAELSFGARLVTTRWGAPDAVLALSPALFASCLALARKRLFHRRTPLVLWVQDLYSVGMAETGQGGLASRVIRAAEGWLFRNADRVVVIHDRFARRVQADFGVRPERISVIRNWTHLTEAPRVDRAAARADFGWGDETVVLHAGNMGQKQGLANVVEAARIADARGSAVRFVLLGDGNDRANLEALAQGIRSIDFVPPIDDDRFVAALQAADVLLVNEKAGVSEMAVPSKLTSYFAAARPVLAATDPDGITAEELRSADAGVVVPAGDPEALLDASLELASDTARADALGANGLAYRRRVLDEAHAVRAFHELLLPQHS